MGSCSLNHIHPANTFFTQHGSSSSCYGDTWGYFMSTIIWAAASFPIFNDWSDIFQVLLQQYEDPIPEAKLWLAQLFDKLRWQMLIKCCQTHSKQKRTEMRVWNQGKLKCGTLLFPVDWSGREWHELDKLDLNWTGQGRPEWDRLYLNYSLWCHGDKSWPTMQATELGRWKQVLMTTTTYYYLLHCYSKLMNESNTWTVTPGPPGKFKSSNHSPVSFVLATTASWEFNSAAFFHQDLSFKHCC